MQSRIKYLWGAYWPEISAAVFVVYMLGFAFPALFDSYAQAYKDRRVLEPFER